MLRQWPIATATDMVQVGIVVPDLQKGVEFCNAVLGTGPFQFIERDVAGHLQGASEAEHIGKTKIAKSQRGRLEFELIQLVEGNAGFRDFLLGRGYGLHHFGFRVTDLDRELATLKPPDYNIILRIKKENINAAFLRGKATGEMIIELVQA